LSAIALNAQDRRRQASKRSARAHCRRRHEELQEIVRGREVGAQKPVELVTGRHLDHGDPLRQLVAVPAQVRELALDQRFGLVELLDRGDYQEHDFRPRQGTQQRADPAAQQARRSSPSRMARQPSAGFSSDVAHIGSTLPPMSRVRKVTGLSPAASSTAR
jgi:hypothetical protein